MSDALNLKDLERRAFKSTFQDGLWDIYLGGLMGALAASALVSHLGGSKDASMIALIGTQLLSLAVLIVGKRLITVPRLGRVKFGATRKRKLTFVGIALTITMLLGVGAFIAFAVVRGAGDGHGLRGIGAPLWFVVVGGTSLLVARLMDFQRLYVIGALFALSIPVTAVIRATAGVDLGHVVFGLVALAILCMGARVLRRFLRDYPLPAAEGADAR